MKKGIFFDKSENEKALFNHNDSYTHYMDYFYNLWMNNYKFNSIDEEQTHFILDQYWYKGCIAGFSIPDTKSDLNPSGKECFTPFAPNMFNIYNFPIFVNLINLRAAPFIPENRMKVGEEVEISYILKNKKPIVEVVDYLVRKIIAAEELIDANINANKMPWMVAVSPEDRDRMKEIMKRIQNNEEVIFADFEDINALKVLLTGAPFLANEINQYKKARVNDLLTWMGIDNVDIEKKEHLIVDEANANNNLINDHGDVFLDAMQDFCDRMNKTFGFSLSVEATSTPASAVQEQKDDLEGGEEDDNTTKADL